VINPRGGNVFTEALALHGWLNPYHPNQPPALLRIDMCPAVGDSADVIFENKDNVRRVVWLREYSIFDFFWRVRVETPGAFKCRVL
jgi:hypothetical protein